MKVQQYFKALSDETRIRIVKLLEHRELSVNEIMAVLGMGQSRVSRHLRVLADSGLLKSRRDGLWVFYSAVDEGEGRAFLTSVESLLRGGIFDIDRNRAYEIAAARLRETRNFFNSIAPEWENIRSELLAGFDPTVHVVSTEGRVSTAVDLGCGTGDLIATLSKMADRVIGIDNSPAMIELARKRFLGANGHVDLRLGELEHLPLPDNEADLVVLNMVMHHLASPAACFVESRRILKNAGVFKIIEFDKHSNERLRADFGDRHLGFSEHEVVRFLETACFGGVGVEEVPLKNGLVVKIYTSRAL
ncbi:MAG TPA: metalloregulator ArsR/SmtB family transcription factor [Spirochaetota bacterium]|jgi:ArsR family transcriptional regulator|nr:MAG: HTH-type transcriptional repressor CzrA [Spirochaetes bacterium ADurb.BinA120]HPI15003.1 metalloregulator ArsR/SmtB family transcription factor [Spirochaetota bacterium]